jgi:hypothetical protein
MTWLAADRAIVTFRDTQDILTNRAALATTVNAWLDATRDP